MSATHRFNAAASPIRSVTVFKTDQAEVVRVFTFDIKERENKVILTNLSSSIDTSSIRVSGLGGSARLADVVCVTPQSSSQLDDVLHEFNQKKKSLESKKQIREQETRLLVDYGKALVRSTPGAAQFTEFLDTFRLEREKRVSAVREIEDELRALEEQISLQTENNSKGQARAKLTITLIADKACSVSLRLTYLVSGAQWQPLYDLYASSEDVDTVSLHYRAQITQFTGEDWTGTQLTLSTAAAEALEIPRLGIYKISRTPTQTFRFPQPPPSGGLFGDVKIRAYPPHPAPAPAFRQQPAAQPFGGSALFGESSANQPAFGQSNMPNVSTGFTSFGGGSAPQQRPGGSLFGAASTNASTPQPTALPPAPAAMPNAEAVSEYDVVERADADPQSQAPMAEGTTTVKSNTFSVSFTVQGSATVPSDGAGHMVSIASFTCGAKITRVCVPRLSTNVFLQCRVENLTNSEYKILPGALSVFLDDDFVSRSSIKDVGASDTFECALGIDPSLQVSYERARAISATTERVRSYGDNFRSTANCTAKTTIHNKGSATVKNIVIQDSLPIASDDDRDKDAFKVVLRKPEGLVDASSDEMVDVRDQVSSSQADKKQLAGLRRKVRWGKIKNGKGGEEEGKYEWFVDILAGEEITLLAEWDVKAPSFVPWQEIVTNSPSA